MRVHSGEQRVPAALQRSVRPLHLPGCGAAHESRSRAGDFGGFACFTKLLSLCGIQRSRRKRGGRRACFSCSETADAGTEEEEEEEEGWGSESHKAK